MTKVWGHSPECMDAVDHPGHVLLIIDVGGLWEEGLGRKPAGYCHWRPLSSTRYTERGLRNGASYLTGGVHLCCLGVLGQYPQPLSPMHSV